MLTFVLYIYCPNVSIIIFKVLIVIRIVSRCHTITIAFLLCFLLHHELFNILFNIHQLIFHVLIKHSTSRIILHIPKRLLHRNRLIHTIKSAVISRSLPLYFIGSKKFLLFSFHIDWMWLLVIWQLDWSLFRRLFLFPHLYLFINLKPIFIIKILYQCHKY